MPALLSFAVLWGVVFLEARENVVAPAGELAGAVADGSGGDHHAALWEAFGKGMQARDRQRLIGPALVQAVEQQDPVAEP